MRVVLSLLVATAVLCTLAACGGGKVKKPASAVSAADKNVIAQYEEVREALAADDMRKTRAAGDRLLKAISAPGVSAPLAKTNAAAKAISESGRIDTMRGAYKDVCKAVIEIAGDVEGYYVFESPMIVDGRWLQSNPKPNNPFLGRALSTLGDPR